MPDIKAVIDIGTNSIKFYMAKRSQAGAIETVKDINEIARLGEGLTGSGTISREALERNARAVAAFVSEARRAGASDIVAAGTMALRVAENADDFKKRVRELAGVDLTIISGGEEARLSYLAVTSGMDVGDGNLAVFDTGGGSTEFVYGRGCEILKKFSINIGAVSITESFFGDDPVDPDAVRRACKFIENKLSAGGLKYRRTDLLVGMGGNVASMSAVKQGMKKYDPDAIHGSMLSRADIEAQIGDYSYRTLEERRGIAGLEPGRADVILAGACIVRVIMDVLEAESLAVSGRSLRHGLMREMMERR